MGRRITPLHHRKLVKVFERDGWQIARQKGSHMIFAKSDFKRTVVIPRYKAVPIFIIKKNMETAKMSRKRFFELLDSV